MFSVDSFFLQEEYELLQRKFMRHILKLNAITPSSQPLPRLVVADFVKVGKLKRKPSMPKMHSRL